MKSHDSARGDATTGTATRPSTPFAAALALAGVFAQLACGGVVETERGKLDVISAAGAASVPVAPPRIDGAAGASVAGASSSAGNVGGAGNVGNSGDVGGAATASGGALSTLPASGVLLTPVDGWLSGSDNALAIQGAAFAYADMFSSQAMTSDFTGANACIRGIAARVALLCTPVAPYTDCYGEYFGAAIGLNLNQPLDAAGRGGTPLPFDASALKGFSFEVSGSTIPAPAAFRFMVTSDAGVDYCNVPTKKVLAGLNTFLFSDLVERCFSITTDPANQPAQTVRSQLVRLSWQVVTNITATVPYDFCVSNLRALPQ